MYHFNMNLFYTFCLICLKVSCVRSAPVKENNTFYDEILTKCPALASDKKFKEQDLFEFCNNWEKINKVTILKEDTIRDVLCLLYFNALTDYCDRVKEIDATVSEEATKFNLTQVCDKLEIIPRDLHPQNSLHKIITKESECKYLCGDEVGWVRSLCRISYYYNCKEATTSTVKASHLLQVNQHTQEKHEKNPRVEASGKGTHVEDNNNINDKQNTETNLSIINSSKDTSKQSTVENIQSSTILNNRDKEDVVKYSVAENKNKNPVGNNNSNINAPSQGKSKSIESIVPAPPIESEINQNTEQELPLNKDTQEKIADNVDLSNNEVDMPSEGNEHPESGEDMEDPPDLKAVQNEKSSKSMQIDELEPVNYMTEMDGDSYFFTYFVLLCVIFIVGYVCYHNKQKILALILEGRRGKRQYRGRRPNSANYHKLDTNLEEAITSSCNKNTNNVIY